MVEMKVYIEIHQLKSLGLNREQVARKVRANVKTVKKYWNMTIEEYETYQQAASQRGSKLTQHKEVILKWLREYPDLSAAQIEDWLKERCKDYTHSQRNIRRFVSRLRRHYGIEKKPSARQYQAVPELPPGFQIQIDFGEARVRKSSGGTTKLYAMVMVLSNSRYKWGTWSDRPLTTMAFINMLEKGLRKLGIPKELVFDQDRLLAVAENFGDIIYTAEFERFKQAMGFRVHLCRASDPESKGRVEAAVKYVKYNFARHRVFSNLAVWNEEFEAWLHRTANSKEHGTTKKVPAECFLAEKQFLRPVPHTNIQS